MARKKKKGPRRILKRKSGKTAVENPMPALPDRRAPEEIGIKLVFEDELDQSIFVLDELPDQMQAEGPPGLSSANRVEPENLASFYRAAAEFYRLAPWKRFGEEAAIRIACDQIEGGPWYAIIIGRAGMTFGLTLYDDLETVKTLRSAGPFNGEKAEEAEALTVLFVTEREVPDADLDAVEHFDLEVAGPDAHPWVFHKAQGMNIRAPLPWEARLLEGCLRAVPRFLAGLRSHDRTEFKTTVSLGAESLEFALTRVED
jgi:hypothetical protein